MGITPSRKSPNDVKRELRNIQLLQADAQVARLRELETRTHESIQFENRSGFLAVLYKLKVDIAHRIAKYTNATPMHEEDAARFRNATKEAFAFLVTFNPVDAIGLAGIPLTDSCRSTNFDENIAFTQWGMEAAGDVGKKLPPGNESATKGLNKIVTKLAVQAENQKNTVEL